MNLPEILDVIESLLNAAQHPDIVKVERYGKEGLPWGPTVERSKAKTVTGIKVCFQATSAALLSGRINPDVIPVPMPDAVPKAGSPARILRAPQLAMLVQRLLDAARPAPFTAWRLVSPPESGPEGLRGTLPYGVEIVCADGTTALLLCQAMGAMVGNDPEEDPFPDWTVPDAVRSWQPA